ncbi:endonuclease/exonuclease/phosphatase family protein [Actinophytocola sp. S1-96]|uniref:Endonuclease/exonuclease/phosphatase family protein n=2 Tax=Actinophytocola gossypii TaxID=2812003 RepID=A0ABT2J6M4_9PSEU|nr:endonuclease/exonuclease/phosphatase family protein [Actinophytocola gossypii]
MPAGAERVAGREVELPVIGPAEGDALHVMSFNLRFAADDEPNSWASRRPVMAELLRRELPTVLGTQEGLYHQLTDLGRDLPGHYAWIGEGRAGGSHGEFMAVFYDTRRLEPLEYDHYWLSDTPSRVGSTSWGNRLPRMVTWVRFADRRTGRELVVVNTHLDAESEYARRRAVALIRERIATFAPDLPVVLTGDFNTPAGDSPSYDILTERMTDTWIAAAERRGSAQATWHGYRPPRRDGERIDWILTRGAVTVHVAAVNTFHRAGQYPSDHLPVQALISLG